MLDTYDQFAERTKSRALDVLLSSLAALRPTIDDSGARALLTDELATRILESAWKYQFDDDRAECRNEIRELVEIAIETREVEAADAAEQP